MIIDDDNDDNDNDDNDDNDDVSDDDDDDDDNDRCGCVPGAQHWVRPLELHRTGVAERLGEAWDPGEHVKSELIGLGPHSVPLFLIKGELENSLFPLKHSDFFRSAGGGERRVGVQR